MKIGSPDKNSLFATLNIVADIGVYLIAFFFSFLNHFDIFTFLLHRYTLCHACLVLAPPYNLNIAGNVGHKAL